MAKFWKEQREPDHLNSPPEWNYKIEECGISFSFLKIEDIRSARDKYSEWNLKSSLKRVFNGDIHIVSSRLARYIRWWPGLYVWIFECNLMIRYRKQIIQALEMAYEHLCDEQMRET